jgi:hypothetical protein
MLGTYSVFENGCPPVLKRLVVVLTHFIAFYGDITPKNSDSEVRTEVCC